MENHNAIPGKTHVIATGQWLYWQFLLMITRGYIHVHPINISFNHSKIHGFPIVFPIFNGDLRWYTMKSPLVIFHIAIKHGHLSKWREFSKIAWWIFQVCEKNIDILRVEANPSPLGQVTRIEGELHRLRHWGLRHKGHAGAEEAQEEPWDEVDIAWVATTAVGKAVIKMGKWEKILQLRRQIPSNCGKI